MIERRLVLSHALLPGAALLVVAVVFGATDLDRTIEWAWAYDKALGTFPARDEWWARDLLHTSGRCLIWTLGLGAFGAWLASYFFEALRDYRRPALFTFVAIGLAVLAIAILKGFTNVDCPWNLIDFGGDRPYVPLFGDRPDVLPRARCFPASHSGSGFALMAFYFALRERYPSTAIAAFAMAIVIGAIFGFGQEASGAHFLSHDLWSAFIVWFVELALYAGAFRGRLWAAAPG
jgi:membrane-associated PAP2 superfamily phosphatase